MLYTFDPIKIKTSGWQMMHVAKMIKVFQNQILHDYRNHAGDLEKLLYRYSLLKGFQDTVFSKAGKLQAGGRPQTPDKVITLSFSVPVAAAFWICYQVYPTGDPAKYTNREIREFAAKIDKEMVNRFQVNDYNQIKEENKFITSINTPQP